MVWMILSMIPFTSGQWGKLVTCSDSQCEAKWCKIFWAVLTFVVAAIFFGNTILRKQVLQCFNHCRACCIHGQFPGRWDTDGLCLECPCWLMSSICILWFENNFLWWLGVLHGCGWVQVFACMLGLRLCSLLSLAYLRKGLIPKEMSWMNMRNTFKAFHSLAKRRMVCINSIRCRVIRYFSFETSTMFCM